MKAVVSSNIQKPLTIVQLFIFLPATNFLHPLHQFSTPLTVQTPNLTQDSFGGQQESGLGFFNPEKARASLKANKYSSSLSK